MDGMDLFTEVREEGVLDIKFTGTREQAKGYITRTIGTLVMLKACDVLTPEEGLDIAASLRHAADLFAKPTEKRDPLSAAVAAAVSSSPQSPSADVAGFLNAAKPAK